MNHHLKHINISYLAEKVKTFYKIFLRFCIKITRPFSAFMLSSYASLKQVSLFQRMRLFGKMTHLSLSSFYHNQLSQWRNQIDKAVKLPRNILLSRMLFVALFGLCALAILSLLFHFLIKPYYLNYKKIYSLQNQAFQYQLRLQRNIDPSHENQLNASYLYFTAPTKEQGVADIQRVVSDLVSEAGLTIHSIQVSDVEEDSFLHKILLRVEASGYVIEVRDFIHALEAYKPILFIEDARVYLSDEGSTQNEIKLPIPLRIATIIEVYLDVEAS